MAFVANGDAFMLIEFSVVNYRSIKERQTFSMVSNSGRELQDSNTISLPNHKLELLRSAAIYGPNASGKTNLIEALKTMEKIVLSSAKGQRGDELPIIPYLFDRQTQMQPAEFEIIFVSNDVRYQYGFAATGSQVLEEWLFAYPKGRAQSWIERKFNEEKQEYEWGKMDKLAGAKSLWQAATRPNALFLSTAIQLNNTQLQPVFDWFDNVLRIIPIGGLSPSFTIAQCESHDNKQEIIDFLNIADFAISDLEITSEKIDIERILEDLPIRIQDELKGRLNSNTENLDIKQYDVKAVHKGADGDRFLLDMKEESDGTQKFFAFAGPWLDVLKNGYVLMVDELNDNLHPQMVKFLVQMFHNDAVNIKNAQLVFTTHETSILSQDVFRRDQVWFTEKDEYNATTLYPLSDFRPRKDVENLEKNYLQGRYGALPYFRDIANLCDKNNAS